MQFVDIDTARGARGLRLVVLGGVPSPWSQAARAIIELKRIDGVLVRLQRNEAAVRDWTGMHNAPVAIYDDEPPRAGWAEILALTERLQPNVALIPASARQRALMHGLSHELMGEGGLLWNSRLFTLEESFASDGQRGFPLPIAKPLAARYGYSHGCGAQARTRVQQTLMALDEQLQHSRAAGDAYYLGAQLSALDIYSATTMNTLAPLPHDQCPMHPVARSAFEWTHSQLGSALPAALIEHRDLMHERHLALPVLL